MECTVIVDHRVVGTLLIMVHAIANYDTCDRKLQTSSLLNPSSSHQTSTNALRTLALPVPLVWMASRVSGVCVLPANQASNVS